MTEPSEQPKFAPWPSFADDERAAVEAVLRSGRVNYWTGTEGVSFEEEFARHVGVKHAVALANGTVALEAALYALDIGPGDDVVVTCRTFIASASAVVMRGARPVLADVDPDSQNVNADTLRAVLTPATKALIVVHLAGWPCEMDDIMALAAERGIHVVEDCAQAHGATYRGRVVGSLGHIGAYSFCQDKIMTTGGEGGMLVTNDSGVWERVWSYKDHGKDYRLTHTETSEPGFRWVHESFGTNMRLTEMQSAIGRVQLRKLADWVARRRRHAAILERVFRDTPAVRVVVPPEQVRHAYYKYYVFVEPERLRKGWDRDRILREAAGRGIPCFSGACPEIYMEKAFQRRNLAPAARFPAARRLGETSLMFMVHPTLSEEDVRRVGEGMSGILREAADT